MRRLPLDALQLGPHVAVSHPIDLAGHLPLGVQEGLDPPFRVDIVLDADDDAEIPTVRELRDQGGLHPLPDHLGGVRGRLAHLQHVPLLEDTTLVAADLPAGVGRLAPQDPRDVDAARHGQVGPASALDGSELEEVVLLHGEGLVARRRLLVELGREIRPRQRDDVAVPKPNLGAKERDLQPRFVPVVPHNEIRQPEAQAILGPGGRDAVGVVAWAPVDVLDRGLQSVLDDFKHLKIPPSRLRCSLAGPSGTPPAPWSPS